MLKRQSMTRRTFNIFFTIFLLLRLQSIGQDFDEPDKELLKKFKIQTVTSWLCEDSTCATKEHFMSWSYDKNGNLLTEFLGDNTDTSFFNKYYYNNENRLIKLDEIGDFLCYEDSERKKHSVITNYIYNSTNQIIEEIKIGGCCNVISKYIYDSNKLSKKIFLNTGCKYHGECDTTILKYYANGKLQSEINKSDDMFVTYKYNTQDQLIEKTHKSFLDTTRIYSTTKYFYSNNKISRETIYEASYITEKKLNSYIRHCNYYYDSKGLLIRMDEIINCKIEHRYIYTY